MTPDYIPLELSATLASWINRRLGLRRFRKQLSARLAARKVLRPYRQDAAQRGWQTRKAK